MIEISNRDFSLSEARATADKSCPCAELIKHYAIKAYGGVDV
jgi:hypothetical protein